MITRHVETSVHGRFLHEDRGNDRLLVGFHGYAESADTHFAELEKLPGIERWSVIAIQALHPFYVRSSGSVVASWMTALDRDFAIADNIAYVTNVLASLPTPRTLVYCGFSQGAAMASRAAAHVGRPAGLLLLGGDIPPEIKSSDLRLPPTLLGRGKSDEWYSDEKFKKDLSYLESTSRVVPLEFDGGHEWTDAYRNAAGRFLEELA